MNRVPNSAFIIDQIKALQAKAKRAKQDSSDAELFRWLCKQKVLWIQTEMKDIDVEGYDLRDALIKAKFEGEE